MFFLCWLVVGLKWYIDKRFLPLSARDWTLYSDIHIVAILRRRNMPNLIRPRTFNDQIRWHMLFAQSALMPKLCDKVGVREYVTQKIGSQYLVPLIGTGSLDDVLPLLTKYSGYLKCSHDSGSAEFVTPEMAPQIDAIRTRFQTLLARTYGVGKGEWPYGLVLPRLIFEQHLPSADGHQSPPDLKVHCVRGIPRLFQVIAARKVREMGALFLPTGERLDFDSRDDRLPLEGFSPEPFFPLASELAGKLSENLDYVRVDFYVSGSRLFFGEMTFFPESGLFQGQGHKKLGELMGLDCSNARKSIYDSNSGKLIESDRTSK